ncbi:MAG: LysR substrate-binding domain-containing protein [Pseudomonadota bacterium]
MINITLKQLRYFEALARHGHFGRAAQDCAISQPALSVQVRQLETELNVQLVERSARAARLTPVGEELVLRARDILASVDGLSDVARAAQGTLSGRLRLGVIPTIAPYLLPRLLSSLTKRHPQLDVHIRETVTSRLIAELSEGRIDAALVALPISESTFEEIALFDEAMMLVRPAADTNAPVPTAADLVEMRLLLLEEGHCFRDQALSFCGTGRGAGLDGSSLSTLVQMVGAGQGVTLIPEMAVGVETLSAPVDVVPLPGAEIGRTVGMIWRRTSPLAGELTGLADLVRDAAQLNPGKNRTTEMASWS